MKRMIEKELYAKKSEISNLTLLGTTKISSVNANVGAVFENIDVSKITPKTLLIFTYANSFVLGMISQTGEGHFPGNIVVNSLGERKLAQIGFDLFQDGQFVVSTNQSYGFTSGQEPSAYLYALSII